MKYPTPRPVRLDDDDLAIVQRIRDAAPAGSALSFSDAVRISLRFWASQNPGLPGQAPDKLVELQAHLDTPFKVEKDV